MTLADAGRTRMMPENCNQLLFIYPVAISYAFSHMPKFRFGSFQPA